MRPVCYAMLLFLFNVVFFFPSMLGLVFVAAEEVLEKKEIGTGKFEVRYWPPDIFQSG